MKNQRATIREYLYEPPGPVAKRRTRIATTFALIAFAVLAVLVIRRFYETGQLDARYWSIFIRYTTWRFLGQGLLGTLKAAGMAGVLTFLAGFLLMTGRVRGNKPARALCTVLIEFTRGVPTLLFIYFFFLVVPQMGVKLPAFWKITLPVAISACGVTAETLRSGVKAVPRGQWEAAWSIGMQDGHVFFKIIIPQAFRYVIPALISELVIVVKDTTFAYVVTFPDLMQNAKVLISNYDAMLSVYLVVAVLYIILNFLLNKASDLARRRLDRTSSPAR